MNNITSACRRLCGELTTTHPQVSEKLQKVLAVACELGDQANLKVVPLAAGKESPAVRLSQIAGLLAQQQDSEVGSLCGHLDEAIRLTPQTEDGNKIKTALESLQTQSARLAERCGELANSHGVDKMTAINKLFADIRGSFAQAS